MRPQRSPRKTVSQQFLEEWSQDQLITEVLQLRTDLTNAFDASAACKPSEHAFCEVRPNYEALLEAALSVNTEQEALLSNAQEELTLVQQSKAQIAENHQSVKAQLSELEGRLEESQEWTKVLSRDLQATRDKASEIQEGLIRLQEVNDATNTKLITTEEDLAKSQAWCTTLHQNLRDIEKKSTMWEALIREGDRVISNFGILLEKTQYELWSATQQQFQIENLSSSASSTSNSMSEDLGALRCCQQLPLVATDQGCLLCEIHVQHFPTMVPTMGRGMKSANRCPVCLTSNCTILVSIY